MQLNVTNTVHFSGFKSENSQVWSSLPISYTIQQAADQHPTFFYFKQWKKSTLIILYLVLFSAHSRHMTNIVHFSGLKVKIVKCDHSLSHTLFGTQQKCDKMHRRTLFGFAEWNSSLWLFSVLYSIRHAPQLNLTYIVHFFFGLQSKKVKFDHSLSHTLFGTWQKFDIHRRCFKFPEWEKSTLIILYLVLYSARSRSVAYIVHFLGLRSEIVNFGYSLSRTLFGTWQKCDIHRRFFKLTKWKKPSTLITLQLVLYSAHNRNVTYIIHCLGLQSEKSGQL